MLVFIRVPLRISFAGGGSDMRSYYQEDDGLVISTSINKYIYVMLHRTYFFHDYRVKYSDYEISKDILHIRHPIVREILLQYRVNPLEVIISSDIPGRSGLGSSSSFTVGFIGAVKTLLGEDFEKMDLVQQASSLEIDHLREPIGKQDHAIAAYGGLNSFVFKKDETIETEALCLPHDQLHNLQNHLILFYTGVHRSASSILKVQNDNMKKKDKKHTMDQLVQIARDLKRSLQNGKIEDVGLALHESWLMKKDLAKGISNPDMDAIYEKALAAGATGGKILGAGGGGFFLFYVDPDKREKLIQTLSFLTPESFEFTSTGFEVLQHL